MVARKTLGTHVTKAALTAAVWALGSSRVLPVYYHAPVLTQGNAPAQMPVVIFSHGLAGTRNAYSSICIDLASRGYVVMAVEHSDGSASVARLPRPASASAVAAAPSSRAAAASDGATPSVPSGISASAAAEGPMHSGIGVAVDGSGISGGSTGGGGGGGSEWCFYAGLGDKPEQLRKTQHRVADVEAAHQLLARLHAGETAGVRELPKAVAEGLRGRLDLSRAAVIGHSYGGATAAAAAAALPCFAAAVSLDPWWDCYDEQWPVLRRWVNPRRPPLLIIGSDDWNTPNAEGKLKCGGPNQERVLAAAAAGGGGSLLVVPRGSTHGSFDDILLLFGKSLSALLRLLGIRTSLQPATAHRINMWCISHFLAKHLQQPAAPAAGNGDCASDCDGDCSGGGGGGGGGSYQQCGDGGYDPDPPTAAAATAAATDAGEADSAAKSRDGGPSTDIVGAAVIGAGAFVCDGAGASAGGGPGITPTTAALAEFCAAEAAPCSPPAVPSPPLRKEDREAYREAVGEWAAVLRLVPGAAAS